MNNTQSHMEKETNKNPRITKTMLNNKRNSKGISLLDFKLYYRAKVMKKHMSCIKIDMLINGIENHKFTHL